MYWASSYFSSAGKAALLTNASLPYRRSFENLLVMLLSNKKNPQNPQMLLKEGKTFGD